MEITSVRVFKVDREGSRVKGYATVVIDDSLMIHNIRIIEGEERMLIAMPSRKINNERYEDVVHPLNSETRTLFEEKILEEYNKPEDDEE